MFNRKKDIVLTASRCSLIERVRLALEVLKGERVRLKEWDFNTDKYFVYVGDTPQEVLFSFVDEDLLDFGLPRDGDTVTWYVAHYDTPTLVRVGRRWSKDDDQLIWTIGRSSMDRWSGPIPSN